jgi:hypothetical protein
MTIWQLESSSPTCSWMTTLPVSKSHFVILATPAADSIPFDDPA